MLRECFRGLVAAGDSLQSICCLASTAPPLASPATTLSAPPCTFVPVSGGAPAQTVEPFETELASYARPLRAYLRMKFPTLSDPDNLVQETFLRVLKARASGQQLTKGFVFTVARNLGCDHVRHERCVPITSLEEESASSVILPEPSAADAAMNDSDVALLTAALAQLPERCREVVTLRKLHGLSHREVASRLGISVKTSMGHMNVGIAKLRDYLVAHGLGPRP